MKKLLSTKYTAGGFNVATLLLRLTFGILFVYYGYHIMSNYGQSKKEVDSFLGMGKEFSLLLKIFIHLICGILLTLGLFSRIAAVFIFLYMSCWLYSINHINIFDRTEGSITLIFFGGSLALLLLGPGKYSIDNAMGK